MTHYYHFVSKTLRDGSPIPADGKWLSVKGKLKICKRGLHASKHVADALRYAPGATLCLVELDGTIISQADKVCARKRKIIARFDATELIKADARASALSVAHLWNMPPIVRQYLESGDESIRRVARDAAYAAYSYAANATAANAAAAIYAAGVGADTVYAADADAAYAVRNANRNRLQAAVDAKFKELLS